MSEPGSKPPIDRICVIGFPSKLGGADTELDHQITCWRRMGVEVHLIHTGPFDKNGLAMKADVLARGCIVHEPRNWRCAEGMHIISFCNGGFLKHLAEIKRFARTTTFVGCMTWPFDRQKAAHRERLIDLELFQTRHQEELIAPHLEKEHPGFARALTVPDWDPTPFPFMDADARSRDEFRFGRISRADADKFHARQLWVYETMVSPTPKAGMILGYNPRIRHKIGNPPRWIRALQCGAVSQQEFYSFASCVIQMSDTVENLPRVGFEAMASGSVLIVDDRGGWRELIRHGETGFLCKDERDFVYHASRLAYEPDERDAIARNARARLDISWTHEAAERAWREIFEKLGASAS